MRTDGRPRKRFWAYMKRWQPDEPGNQGLAQPNVFDTKKDGEPTPEQIGDWVFWGDYDTVIEARDETAAELLERRTTVGQGWRRRGV